MSYSKMVCSNPPVGDYYLCTEDPGMKGKILEVEGIKKLRKNGT
jgi:hypothetical protein